MTGGPRYGRNVLSPTRPGRSHKKIAGRITFKKNCWENTISKHGPVYEKEEELFFFPAGLVTRAAQILAPATHQERKINLGN